MDKETDRLIQQTIKENFEDATVIVLASRFNLIMEVDRIMVMHEGRIIEFDTPLALLDNPRSKFMKMIAQSGDVDLIKLRQIAISKEKQKTSGMNISGAKPMLSLARKSSPLASQSAVVQIKDHHHNDLTVSSNHSDSGSSIRSSDRGQMPKSLENLFLGKNTSSTSVDKLAISPNMEKNGSSSGNSAHSN